MEKKDVYQERPVEEYETGGSKFLKCARVPRGRVLKVTHMAGTFKNIASTEYVVLGYYDGSEYVELASATPLATDKLVHWNGEVYLIENQYLYAYFADVAAGEEMKVWAQGRWENV